jgi:hypothetical protein
MGAIGPGRGGEYCRALLFVVTLKGKWFLRMRQVGIDKKQVVIDNKKGVVEVEGKRIPRLLLGIIRGGVGKCFVVKHYRGKKKGRKIVVTRYPNMSGIVVSEKQRERRNLFREAVVYAKWIVGDEERKQAFRKTLPRKRRKHVYQAAIRLYMSMQGDPKWLRKQLAVKAMVRSGALEWEEKEIIEVKAMKRIYTEDVLVKSSNADWWRIREDEAGFPEYATSATSAKYPILSDS